jgi:hypothetical protein
MTDYDFGDVVLVPFPFTDQTTIEKASCDSGKFIGL